MSEEPKHSFRVEIEGRFYPDDQSRREARKYIDQMPCGKVRDAIQNTVAMAIDDTRRAADAELARLRDENARLRDENARMREALEEMSNDGCGCASPGKVPCYQSHADRGDWCWSCISRATIAALAPQAGEKEARDAQ